MKATAWIMLLTGAAAGPLPGQKVDKTIEVTVRNAFKAWETMNADAPQKFYTSDPNAVFYDIAPLKYTGWKEYRDGVEKNFFANNSSLRFQIGDDLKVQQKGNVAWAACTFQADVVQKSGKQDHFEGRYSGVLTKQGKDWKIVHEHVSVPMQ